MLNFSAVNPSYPNACVNETITGLPSTTTAASFDSNRMAKKFGALLGQTCSSRGFTEKRDMFHPMVFHPTTGVTINWNGQVWTK